MVNAYILSRGREAGSPLNAANRYTDKSYPNPLAHEKGGLFLTFDLTQYLTENTTYLNQPRQKH